MINLFDFESQMTRIIPSFAGFTEFTTSVPKIYWDVKSQEQRIHGICKLLHKCICYADMLGDNVNEIAQTLQDIEDGKLDELILAAIAEWFEEHEQQILTDITDLQDRVGALEDADVLINDAIAGEALARQTQDGLLSDAIEAEERARIQQDNIFEDYASIKNDTFDFQKPMDLQNSKTDAVMFTMNGINADDFDNFTYAGKTLDEIFDSSKPWVWYLQPDTLASFPDIKGVTPIAYGEVLFDADEGYFTFESTGAFAGSSAYLYWNPMPATGGHRIAYYAEFEVLSHRIGNTGFGTSGAYCFSSNNAGIAEIVGSVKEIAADANSMGLLFGNLPQTTSVYVWEPPTMKARAKNLCIIDLDVLFADGEVDNPDGFANAYQAYIASKDSSKVNYTLNVLTELHADLDDFKAFDNFVNAMNQYAYDMKFANSEFNSPSGLPRPLGSELTDIDLNNFSCPIDMLKVLIACGNNSFLQHVMTQAYYPVTMGQGTSKTTVLTPNTQVDPSIDLPYKRIYGKSGSVNRNFTGNYAPYGVLNTITACALAKGHVGYISLFNTPLSSGSGLVYNNVWRYFYCIQNALNQIINGTDPENVVYIEDLQNAMNYSAQPTCFAAFIAPSGFDKGAAVAMPASNLKAWLQEGKVYLSNQDGLTTSDTRCVTASTAKALTAYIAVNECRLDDVIVMKDIDYTGGSGSNKTDSTWKSNELPLTLRDAIAAMLYYSDNRIANAIARHVGRKISTKAVLGSSFVSLDF